MKRFLFYIVATILTLSPVCAAEISKKLDQVPEEKAAEIRKLLRLTGMEKLVSQVVTQMISTMRAQETGVPEEFWKRFEERIDPRELIALIIPLYDKYYTTEDLKAINSFYASPVGQKVMSTLPQITQESMKIGQEWGQQLGARIAQEIEAERKKSKSQKKPDL